MMLLAMVSLWVAAAPAPLTCPPGTRPVVNKGPGFVEEYCASPKLGMNKQPLRDGPYRQRGDAGNRTEGEYAAGTQHGLWRTWSAEGKLLSEETFDHGQPRPPYRHFYPDGSPQDAMEARDGGGRTYQRWYRNGKRSNEGASNAAGQKDGAIREWSEAGQLRSESHWAAGLKEGTSKTWFANGKLAEESTWRGGEQVGRGRSFYETGAVREEATFDDAGHELTWAAYAPDGRQRKAGPCVDDGDCALIPAPVCRPCGASALAAISMVDQHYNRIPKAPVDCPPGPFPCTPPGPAKAVCREGNCSVSP